MKSFRFRILVLVLSLVMAPLGATMFALTRKADDAAIAQASTELRAGATVARESLNFHGQQLSVAAHVLTADFGFKEAIASAEQETILSALKNHGARLHADLLAAFDVEGQLLASTATTLSADAITQLRYNMEHAAPNTNSFSYSIIDGVPYLMVSATVRAPKPIARIILGFALSESLTRDIAQIVGMDVAFIARDARHHVTMVSSARHTGIDANVELGINANNNSIHRITNNNSLLVQRELLTATNGALILELFEPLSHATKAYSELQSAILFIGGSALLGALLIGMWLTHAATRPIATLTAAAERIEHGDYTGIKGDNSATEFRQLSAAFTAMGAAVAEREQRILFQSQHDKLTGLANYDALRSELAGQISARSDPRQSIALCLINLIEFSDINAALGHTIGDRLLCEVAQRLVNKLGNAGMVARVGSKQFLLMIPNCDLDAMLLLSHDIMALLHQPIDAAEIPVTLNIRCGIAMFPQHGTHPEELIRRADLALLQAQQAAIHIACFDPATEARHQRQIQVLGDLQHAIEASQLHLVYQPKMNIVDRRIISCETLVRWRHPVYGNVSPAEFIPHAERTGSIRQLTRWVLNTALAQLADWQRAGKDFELAINLSAADIADITLPEEIINLLTTHNIAAHKLILEITESTVMNNTDTALHAIAQLRTHGIKFSIDDFGTGHSSLAQLRRLPVDELKLEGSLVADLALEERARMIVRAMTDLGHSLGLRVVAEGIETVQLLRAVAHAGCDIAQGYLIAKPMPAVELLSWLDNQRITDTLGNATMTATPVTVAGRTQLSGN